MKHFRWLPGIAMATVSMVSPVWAQTLVAVGDRYSE